ncbi:MAG TPA: diaminopimelate epimerase [Helicobacteraceae bacterium]|nr:diaminopimelate epimerase [Helicobacteraceae bacterium]
MQVAKYSANGNDFVIYHTFLKKDRSQIAERLCNRQNGVGADGLIVLIPHDTLDFEWQFYNADGSHADMCGNGSRACAHYAFVNGLASESMTFLTGAGEINANVDGNMVQSQLTPPKILEENLQIGDKNWWLIDTGVPHLITFDADIEHFDTEEARSLRNRYNCNVNIASIDGDNTLRVRTYERGVEDETLACGTGMASAFYRAYKEEKVGNQATVLPRSGDTLYLGYSNETITFKGEVTAVFETSIQAVI